MSPSSPSGSATQGIADRTNPAANASFTITFGTLTFTINLSKEGTLTQQSITTIQQPNQIKPTQKETKKIANQNHLSATTSQQPANPKWKPNPYHANAQRKSQHKRNGSPQDVQTTSTRETAPKQRFVKAPPATEQWQRVVRKKSQSNSQKSKNRKCFHCHKYGHIQKFCWQRLKCYSCGRAGHKWANCLFKNQNSKSPKQADEKQQKNQQTIAPPSPGPNMEFLLGRPPLGNIYCPTRITLNQHNEYLNSVGLIVLLRGSPSPQLPALIAQKLAEVHGGHIEEYEVSEAAITPYLLTCPNPLTRDAVVQRGLYSVPQHQLQFRVHEWRPRFGMGHNPPTHQVWVKVIGLPLQAWTAPEVARILQKFGHPLQVLPFGRDAGHYRDITALVETADPSLIPLAYVYREGDYSTQIDILILSWRQWDDSYYPPPPPDPPFQDAHPAQPNHHDNQMTPHRTSSHSSSSNGQPSEPTIDYSSWSPRSYRISIPTNYKPKPKLTHRSSNQQQAEGNSKSQKLPCS